MQLPDGAVCWSIHCHCGEGTGLKIYALGASLACAFAVYALLPCGSARLLFAFADKGSYFEEEDLEGEQAVERKGNYYDWAEKGVRPRTRQSYARARPRSAHADCESLPHVPWMVHARPLVQSALSTLGNFRRSNDAQRRFPEMLVSGEFLVPGRLSFVV